jgi:hypothetical protein
MQSVPSARRLICCIFCPFHSRVSFSYPNQPNCFYYFAPSCKINFEAHQQEKPIFSQLQHTSTHTHTRANVIIQFSHSFIAAAAATAHTIFLPAIKNEKDFHSHVHTAINLVKRLRAASISSIAFMLCVCVFSSIARPTIYRPVASSLLPPLLCVHNLWEVISSNHFLQWSAGNFFFAL